MPVFSIRTFDAVFSYSPSSRSDLEEEREVNHHGHAVKVDGDGNFLAPGERYTE